VAEGPPWLEEALMADDLQPAQDDDVPPGFEPAEDLPPGFEPADEVPPGFEAAPSTGATLELGPSHASPLEMMASHEVVPPGVRLERRAILDTPRSPPPTFQVGPDVERLGQYLTWMDRNTELNPQEALEAVRIAAASGQPVEYVARNLPDLRKAWPTNGTDWAAIAREHPDLSHFILADPATFALARDDVANLTRIEYWLTGGWKREETGGHLDAAAALAAAGGWLEPEELGEAGHLRSVPTVFGAVTRDALKEQELVGRQAAQALTANAPITTLEELERAKAKLAAAGGWMEPDEEAQLRARIVAGDVAQPADSEWRQRNAARIAELQREVPAAKDYGPAARTLVGRIFLAPAKFAPMVAGSVAATAAGTAAVGPAGGAAALVAFNSYENFGPLALRLQELRDDQGRPIDPDFANAAAGAVSLAAGTAMSLGLGPMLRKLPGASQLLEEATTHVATRAVASEAAQATLGRAAAHFGEHVVSGAGAMALQAGLNQAAEEVVRSTVQHDYTPKAGAVAEEVWQGFWHAIPDLLLLAGTSVGSQYLRDVGRVRASRESEARLAQAVQVAKGSRLLERAPLELERLLGNVKQRGASTVYVNLEAWDRYWRGKGLDPREAAAQARPDGAKAYDEATATRGDLPFGVDTFLARLVKEGHAEQFLPDVRLSLDELTPRQAREEQDAARAARGRARGAEGEAR
jgi:hypothetical protein